jgi:hypothetical protein
LIIQQVSYSQNDTLLTDKSPNFRIGYNSKVGVISPSIGVIRSLSLDYKRHQLESGIFFPRLFYLWDKNFRKEMIVGYHISYSYQLKNVNEKFNVNLGIRYSNLRYATGSGDIKNYNRTINDYPNCNPNDCRVVTHRFIDHATSAFTELEYFIYRNIIALNLSFGVGRIYSSSENIHPLFSDYGAINNYVYILPMGSLGIKVNIMNINL